MTRYRISAVESQTRSSTSSGRRRPNSIEKQRAAHATTRARYSGDCTRPAASPKHRATVKQEHKGANHDIVVVASSRTATYARPACRKSRARNAPAVAIAEQPRAILPIAPTNGPTTARVLRGRSRFEENTSTSASTAAGSTSPFSSKQCLDGLGGARPIGRQQGMRVGVFVMRVSSSIQPDPCLWAALCALNPAIFRTNVGENGQCCWVVRTNNKGA